MARDLTAGMATAVAAVDGEFIHFIELQFSGGTQRLSTGPVTMPWDSETWEAIGGDLGIGVVEEAPDLSSGDVEIRLSGVDQGIIATLLTEQYLGRIAKVWLVHLSAAAIVADPLLLFEGYMNGGWSINEFRPDEGGGTVTVTGRLVSRVARLDQRKGFQTNVTSHQAVYAGDRFFQFTNAMRYQPLVWG